MKSLAELNAIKQRVQENSNNRKNASDNDIKVVIGMATCGIAAGARPVLNAFIDEVAKRKLQNVIVSQTGCIGMCKYEPIVEVFVPGQPKVTYVKVEPTMVPRIITDHIVNNNVVAEYTIK
ncbi:MAG: (2Fe-2S) ferredoxin domain-containing protein [Clostridia bacterium]|nr:(2Fe-2S) ferredoxin domain-containing protein [Clostridia bacterium]